MDIVTETRWLDDDEHRAWCGLIAMHTQLMARLNRQLQDDSGLSLTDFDVLSQLTDHHEGKARNFELADSLQWEKSRLSHHLGRMQRRGLISREDCPDDGRGALVVLTAEGRRAIEEAAPGHVTAVRRWMFDHLGPDQVTALREVTETVLAQLAPQPPSPTA
ncbi:MarR family winged helix-turn-helix transcriptional regulator [Streptomyces sp. x-19]|uniref:MarR family winged helix-turn-helix transcriptional regulator n=1 Tax=Streptomyces sp. x-19 TaxID=2789280 RepID=UPI00397F37DC